MIEHEEYLGNYHLLRQLGESKFAQVYLAEHIHLANLVVIKVLHTQHIQQEHIASFRREAQLLARLEHTHIVRLLNFDLNEGSPFLVMSYAPGGSLQERHPLGCQVPLPLVNEYVQQIAEALQYAHEQQVVHRNIKPKNLLIGSRGEILLSDFSIAAASQGGTSGLVSTPTYIAPEQVYQQAVPASDQYALGVLIYEWLCGRTPFQGTFAEILLQHCTAPVPALNQYTALSPAIEKVVLKALAKQPEQRFSSVKAFAEEFQRAITQQEQTARTNGEYAVAEQTVMVLRGTMGKRQEHEPSSLDTPPLPAAEDAIKHFPLFRDPPRWRDVLIILAYAVSLVLLILLAILLKPPTTPVQGSMSSVDLSIVLLSLTLWVFIGTWILLAGALLGWWRGSCVMLLVGLLLFIWMPQALPLIFIGISTALVCTCSSGWLLQHRKRYSFLTSWGFLSLAFILSSSWMMLAFQIAGGLSSPSIVAPMRLMSMLGPLETLFVATFYCVHCLGGGLFLAPLVAGIEFGIGQFDLYRHRRQRI